MVAKDLRPLYGLRETKGIFLHFGKHWLSTWHIFKIVRAEHFILKQYYVGKSESKTPLEKFHIKHTVSVQFFKFRSVVLFITSSF